MEKIILFFATGFGSGIAAFKLAGLLRRVGLLHLEERWTGAGFLGTVVGFALIGAGVPMQGWTGFWLVSGWTVFSIFISGEAERIYGRKDDSRIVIDEVAGAFWTMAFVPLADFSSPKKLLLLLLGFVLFRIFDVAKLPFRSAQNLQGGLGVVADDCLAGLLANLILQILIRFVL